MPDIIGATNATSQVANAVSSSTIASSATGALGSLSGLFSGDPPLKLPMPNPLAGYASYQYLLSLSVLSDADLNNPDQTYMKGKVLPILAKTANVDPNNRIKTAYGKFDFFIDNLEIVNTLGQRHGKNNMISTISFDILEPYSMGLFLQSVQAAAYNNGHKAYTEAPFLFKIEFRGAKENGSMSTVPNTTRYFVFRFAEIGFKVTSSGTTYHCTGYNWASQAFTNKYNQLKSDKSIQGKTIQEVLQSGPESLQAVVNRRFQQLVKDGTIKVADEIVIMFPTDISSAGTSTTSGSAVKNTATTTPSAQTADDIGKKIGVSRNDKKLLVQAASEVNEIGASSMGFSLDRKAGQPTLSEEKVYDPATQTWVRSTLQVDPKTGNFTFAQDSTVVNAITQVVLASEWIKKTLGTGAVDGKGQRNWFNIESQVYNVSTDDNLKSTGQKPKLIVYRVVPYTFHISSAPMATNTKPPVDKLLKEAAKRYDYIYTGKNSEVINFNIEFSTGFAQIMAADNLGLNPDKVNPNGASLDRNKEKNEQQIVKDGNNPAKGTTPSALNYTQTLFHSERQGGTKINDDARRAASVFHQAITKGIEQMELNLEIVGDPYFLAQSGQGNYTSKPTSKQNVNKDMTVNWQNGQVDLLINFRTPIDINQSTGLYNFGAGTKTVPVTQFSGLYHVVECKNTFKGGKFTQALTGMRRPLVDAPSSAKATPDQVGNTDNTKPDVSNKDSSGAK